MVIFFWASRNTIFLLPEVAASQVLVGAFFKETTQVVTQHKLFNDSTSLTWNLAMIEHELRVNQQLFIGAFYSCFFHPRPT